MVEIDKRDANILLLIKYYEEIRYSQIEKKIFLKKLMAKETLCNHLKFLEENRLIRKALGKDGDLKGKIVYKITKKGLKILQEWRDKPTNEDISVA